MFCEMQVMVFFDTLSLKKAEKICINQTLDGFREGLKMPDRSIDPVSKFSLICDLLKKIGLLITTSSCRAEEKRISPKIKTIAPGQDCE